MMASESMDHSPAKRASAVRRALWLFAACLAFLIFIVATAPHMIEKSGFKAIMLAKLGVATGLEFRTDSPLQLRTLPGGQISLVNVNARSANNSMEIKAGKVTADFDILPLIAGSVNISTFTIQDAIISANIDGVSFLKSAKDSPLVALIATAASGSDPARFPASISCIRCDVVLTGSRITNVQLDGFNGRWNWAGGASRASVFAEFNWRGEPVALNMAADNLEDLRDGVPTRVVSDVTSGPAKLSFEGQSNLATNLFAEGHLTFEAPSLKEFLAWSTPGETAGESIDALSLSATMSAKDGKMLFSDMALSTAGAPATGVFELDMTGSTPKTSGTLAFDAVELPSLLTSLPLGFNRGANLDQLDRIDLDMRISAKTVKIGKYEITNAAGAIKMRDGSADLDLGMAEFGGGNVQSRLSIESNGPEKVASLSMNIRDVNAEKLSEQQTGTPALLAPVSIKVDASGPYKSARAFLDQAIGTVSVEVDSGVIRNFSMDGFLKSLSDSNGFDLSDAYAGMSDITKGEIVGRLRDGLVLVDTASFTLSGTDMRVVGIIPLADRGFGLSGKILNSPYTMPIANFFIGGSWNRPVITTGPSNP